MKIRFLGVNNTTAKDSGYTCFLVDGILGVDAGNIATALTLDEQRKVKAVLLSHAHYDHIRELPALAFNNVFSGKAINVFASKETLDLFYARFSDGRIYPDFVRGNKDFEKNVLVLNEIRGMQSFRAAEYEILAVPIPHAASSLGYQITRNSKSIFYTGDTGPGLTGVWEKVSPQTLIIELTLPDRLKDFARESHHLCPALLREELGEFRSQKGYLPRVLAVHRNPEFDAEIIEDATLRFGGTEYNVGFANTDEIFEV